MAARFKEFIRIAPSGLIFIFILSLVFIYSPLIDLWIENDSETFFEKIKGL